MARARDAQMWALAAQRAAARAQAQARAAAAAEAEGATLAQTQPAK
jgi:hypothetical protein